MVDLASLLNGAEQPSGRSAEEADILLAAKLVQTLVDEVGIEGVQQIIAELQSGESPEGAVE